MVDLEDYKEEKKCLYKGETYLVRDNGAIMRLPKEGKRPRKLDNQWTFGVPNPQNGYMIFASSIRVHQVVATAFYGEPKTKNMVVDHKDTNRRNNRPENLHWVTKLENALNNPITRKKIIHICGSIEKFLDNPNLLFSLDRTSSYAWMRNVTKEEAAACKRNLDRWASIDSSPSLGSAPGAGFGEWVYKEKSDYKTDTYVNEEESDEDVDLSSYPGFASFINKSKGETSSQAPLNENSIEVESAGNHSKPNFIQSLTSNALQENWNTPSEFPLCPQSPTKMSEYFEALVEDAVFSKNRFGESKVVEAAISPSHTVITLVTYNESSAKEWGMAQIYEEGGMYIHANVGTYFDRNGALKELTLWQGKEWTGGETFDDYC